MSGKCFRPDSTEMAFVAFERAPAFRGGEQALMQYLAGNIFYPKKARKKGVQGSVVVQFVVEKSGKISSVEAVQRIGGGCDEEAVRVVSEMPDWSPGYMDDRPVKVRFTLPIRFRLE